MRAIISGQAGVLVLVDNKRVSSRSLDGTDLIVRQARDIPHLFADATDVVEIEDTSYSEAISRLQTEWQKDRALHLMLLLLDSDVPPGTRRDAADCADQFVSNSVIRQFVLSRFHAAPLPPSADLVGAYDACPAGSFNLRRLLEQLEASQREIRRIRVAWDSLPEELFASANEKAEFFQAAVESGFLRELAERSPSELTRTIARYSASDQFQEYENCEQLLRTWADAARDDQAVQQSASAAPLTQGQAESSDKLVQDRSKLPLLPALDQRRMVLMFADMADSSALKLKLGDGAYSEKVCGPRDAIFRKVLADTPEAKEIKNTGDGFIAAFPFVSDAVNAALRFQHEISNYPWEKDAPRTRIGIHVGEAVVVKGAGPGMIDVQGRAVDMCSRVMSLGLGGQILLTRNAYDDGHQFVREHPQVRGRGESELRWLFHGRYRFKGKEADPLEVFEVGAPGSAPFTKPPNSAKASRVVDAEDRWQAAVSFVESNKYLSIGIAAAFVIAVALSIAYRVNIAPASGTQTTRSVAIFDLRNASGIEDESWLSDNLARVLSNNLSIGNELVVIPAHDIFQATRDLNLTNVEALSAKALRDVKRRLNADYAVTGSYMAFGQNSGWQVRVQVRLYDTTSGKTLASINGAGTEKDIFGLLGAPSDRLRQELGVAPVTVNEVSGVFSSVPSDPVAARFYTEGLRKLNSFDSLGATVLLQEAIAAAPKFALIHADLAQAWSELGHDSKAREEAQKAFDLLGDLSPQKHSLEARYREMTYEWDKALQIYRTLWIRFPNQPEFGFRLAAAQTAAGRGRDALSTLEELQEPQLRENADGRIEAQKAEAYEALSDYRGQNDSAIRAAEFATKSGARQLLAQAPVMQCRASLNLGETKQAIGACEEARRISELLGNRAGIARSLSYIVTALANQGDMSGAWRTYDEALRIAGEIGDKYDMQRAMKNLGNVLFQQGDLTGSKRLYDEGLVLARERGSKPEIAILLGNLANVQIAQGKFAVAETECEQALSTAREVNNGFIIARALYNLALIATRRGDLEGAMKYHQESLAVRSQLGLKSGIAETKVGIGDILLARSDLEGAYGSYVEALSIQNELGEKNSATYTQLSLAEVSLLRGQTAQAETLFRQTADDFRSQKDDDDESLARAGLTRALVLEKRLTEAQQEERRATEHANRSADVTVRLTVAIASARLSASLGRYEEASRILRASLAEATKAGLLSFQFETQLALGEIAMMSGNDMDGRVVLNLLKKSANARGFSLIARRAGSLVARK